MRQLMLAMRNLILACVGLVAAPSVASADCQPALGPGSSSVNFAGLSIGTQRFHEVPLSVVVSNSGSDPCSLVLRVSRTLAGSTTPLPPYGLLGPAGQVEIIPFGSSAGTTQSDIVVNVAAQSTRTIPLAFRLPTGWGLQSGIYSDQLQVALISDGNQQIDSRNIAVTIDIPAAATLRLYGAGGGTGPNRIHLPALSSSRETRSDPFALRVWSTSPYDISFVSDNQGNLIHDNGVDRIPYQLTMGGNDVDLAAAGPFHFGSHTSAAGDVHRLVVRVAPVRALAGEYSDRVTVTVTAL